MLCEIAILGFVAGALLGLRYKVLILVMAVLFALILAAIVGVGRADSLSSIVLMMGVLGGTVQLGYIAGIAIRAVAESIGGGCSRGRLI
jgi:hypothetical protein